MAGERISCNNEDFMFDQRLILMNLEGNFVNKLQTFSQRSLGLHQISSEILSKLL